MALETGRQSAKYALSLAAVLAAAGMALPAAAADLGGNCCADLEERVAELEATTARKGNRKVSLTISGQVTTGVLAWDDGDKSDVYVVDNTNAGSTFFVFAGNAKINPTLTAGFDLAVGITTGARSHQVSQIDDDGGAAADSNLALLRANWYLDHKELGRLTVGRINTASAGVVGLDLGGISVIANANVGYWNAGFFLEGGAGPTWGDLLGGGTVFGAGLSRANAVSYTSPTFGGFSVAAAWGEDDLWDVALRYAGEHSGFRVAAAIAYADNVGGLGDFEDNAGADGREVSQVKGSASVLHVPTGLFAQGTYLTQDNDERGSDDTVLWQIQGGIAKNWTGLGNTVFYGEYANVSDAFGQVFDGVTVARFNNSDTDIWGLGVVQHIDAAAMELFLSYRHFEGSAAIVPATGARDASEVDAEFDAVFGGARIRF
jgi:hypothetical protein